MGTARGASKSFAVAHPAVVRELVKVKDSYNCDVLSLAAALFLPAVARASGSGSSSMSLPKTNQQQQLTPEQLVPQIHLH